MKICLFLVLYSTFLSILGDPEFLELRIQLQRTISYPVAILKSPTLIMVQDFVLPSDYC